MSLRKKEDTAYEETTNTRLQTCVQSHSILLRQHVSATPVTFIRVSSNKNTFSIQITARMCVITALTTTFDILKRLLCTGKFYVYILVKIK